MATLIRLRPHGVHRDTGGDGMLLIKRPDTYYLNGFEDKWYKHFIEEANRYKKPSRNLVPRMIYGGSMNSSQDIAAPHGLETREETFSLNAWCSGYRANRWLKGLEVEVKTAELIPIIGGDGPSTPGEVFDSSKINWNEFSKGVTEGFNETIWNSTAVIDIHGDGTNNNKLFAIYESAGTSWGTFNLWGNVTLTPVESGGLIRRKAVFRGGTDDMAIAVNIFGNVTLEGSLEQLTTFSRAFSLIMVHDGATLTVKGGRGNPRGGLCCFGSGKVVGI